MYADYKRIREEMRALQTAKANVDRILETDVPSKDKSEMKEGKHTITTHL